MASITILTLAGAHLLVLSVWITVVDLRSLRIPDGLNASLAIGGVGFQIASQKALPVWPIIGAASLCLALYGLREIYLRRRGVVGLGLGDVKMAGASALWLHPANLSIFVLLSSTIALVSVFFWGRNNQRLRSTGRMPFGPFLAFGLVACWCLENFAGIGPLTQ